MGSESYKKSMKTLSERRENALVDARRKEIEIRDRFPRAQELMNLLSHTGGRIAKVVFSGGEHVKEELMKIMEENLSWQKELVYILREHGYPDNYLEIHYSCQSCEDTGYVNGGKCSCLRDLITKYNTESFNAESNISPAGFYTFNLNYYSDIPLANNRNSPRKTMGDILQFCKSYAELFQSHSPNVLMIGDTGLGKTHLSLSIAEQVMKKGYSVLYTSAPDLFRRLQGEYYGKGSAGVDTMEMIIHSNLIIIDDLGVELENQFNISTLYNIVNTRLNASIPTIINTNLTPKELEKRYSDRITSRLMTMYKCLKFAGKDVRQIKLRNNEM